MDLPQVSSFRQIIDVELQQFFSSCRGFGLPLSALVDLVSRAFDLELNYISAAVRHARPEDMGADQMFQEFTSAILEIQAFRDRNRACEQFFNHLATVAESIVALNWIRFPNTPVPFIRDMIEAGDYFGNRVLSANRGNQDHIAWINNWRLVMRAVEGYVRQHFRTGLTFGIAGQTAGGDAATTFARAAGGDIVPPPPAGGDIVPPPPPPPPANLVRPDPQVGVNNREALLNELNQGVAITQMLRPVRPVRPAAEPRRQPAAGTSVQGQRGPPPERVFPPKFMLEGRKWRVEHQKNNLGLTLNPNNMSESLAMFKCENAALDVTDKMTGVTIDNCKRTTVIVKDIIASVELIRCENVQLKCLGVVSTITLDSCDSVQVYLSEDARGAEHVLSKCTSINICLLEPDGEYVELPVPEQIRTIVVDGRLRSSVVSVN